MGRKSEREEAPTSPIAFQPGCNGEFPPGPRTAGDDRAEALFARMVSDGAHRLGMSRRDFAGSASGMVAAMLVMNEVYGCSRSGGGQGTPGDGGGFSRADGHDVPGDVSAADAARAAGDAGLAVDGQAVLDQAQAADATGPLAGEIIFDVQTHNRVAKPPWLPDICATPAPVSCPSEWIRQIFVASDTAVACLSGFPSPRANDQPSIQARARIKEIVDQLGGSPRLVLHSNVRPIEGQAELDAMAQDAAMFPVVAWKVYPEARGLDTDDVGRPFLERARSLGVKVIAAHRGLNGDGSYLESGSPRDLAVAAKANPDLTFLTYHSGWQPGVPEDHPFNPADPAPRGVDRLIKAALDNGVAGANLYAELGTTWYSLMREPAQAAHVLGKLLKYLGPDRVLWGTDSVNNGGPQEQIVPFRLFEIPVAMQAMFGYPALTVETKRKIFGLNAARVYGVDLQAMRRAITNDDVSKIKLARLEDPRAVPVPRIRGARTRREYLFLRRHEPA
jgi:hypothetical protein